MSDERDLRLLGGAVFLSAAGDLLALIVLALQVHELTGSGVAVSALFAATLVPVVALAPLAGIVADRFESVRVIVVTALLQAVVAVVLAFSTGLPAILALASLLAAGAAFGQPAEFALVPAAAGARGVARATGALEAARYAGFAAGPLLAAGLAALGPRAALLANAASFVAIAAAAAMMRARRPPGARRPGERMDALAGLRLLRGDRVLRLTIGAAVGALLFISASLTAEIFYVKDVVGASDAAYALVVAAWMAGVVCGAGRAGAPGGTAGVAAAALLALAVQGAGMALQTAWAILPVAFAGYLVGGLGHGVKNALLRTLISTRVPAAVHGRAFAAYGAARNAAELGAVGAGGLLVGAVGPRAALLIAGLGPVLAAAAGLAGLRRPQRRLGDRQRAAGAGELAEAGLPHEALNGVLGQARVAAEALRQPLPDPRDQPGQVDHPAPQDHPLGRQRVDDRAQAGGQVGGLEVDGALAGRAP